MNFNFLLYFPTILNKISLLYVMFSSVNDSCYTVLIYIFCSFIATTHNTVKERLQGKSTDDIYCKQVRSTCEGLVDTESEDKFYKEQEDKRDHWDSIEKEHPGCIAGFYDTMNTKVRRYYLQNKTRKCRFGHISYIVLY